MKPCYHPKPAAVAAGSKKTLNPACAEFKPGIATWKQSEFRAVNPPVATVAPVAALNLAMTTEVKTYPHLPLATVTAESKPKKALNPAINHALLRRSL